MSSNCPACDMVRAVYPCRQTVQRVTWFRAVRPCRQTVQRLTWLRAVYPCRQSVQRVTWSELYVHDVKLSSV